MIEMFETSPNYRKPLEATQPRIEHENPFVNHVQVRKNEAIIWEHICDEIGRTIEHLQRGNTVNIVDIGGASLQGLEAIAARGYYSNVRYTIVDQLPPFDSQILTRHSANYIQKDFHNLHPLDFDQIDFVVSVRTLEYDPKYWYTLNILNSRANRPSYGIFVHNAESSPIFEDVRRYKALLEFRIKAYSIISSLADGSITQQEALTYATNELSILPEIGG